MNDLIKTELKTYRVEKKCPKCEDGKMQAGNEALISFPPLYPHTCDTCAHQANYRETYPATIHEHELPTQAPEPKQEEFQPWRPEYGDTFWYIGQLLFPEIARQDGTGFMEAIAKHHAPLTFSDGRQAEKVCEYLRTLVELMSWSDGLDGEFYITWEPMEQEYRCQRVYEETAVCKLPHTRFKTPEQVHRAIRHFGNRLDVIYR